MTLTTSRCKSEHQEQVDFVQWMRKNHPEIRFFSIPNGGSRHPVEAMNLKSEGCSPGVPDLMIPELKLFIEMKIKGGIVSEEQKTWIEYLRSVGYQVAVCWSCEEAIESIEQIIEK